LVVQQVRLEDGAYHQHHRHHDHAVTDARDAECAASAIALRYPHSQQGPRAIGPVAQLLYDRFQPMLLALGLKVLRELSE
jgi:hypothetical protein